MLNRVVLNPLAVITSEAEAIGTRSYLSARLNLERDEIGALAVSGCRRHLLARLSKWKNTLSHKR
jgi:hypothetical protein